MISLKSIILCLKLLKIGNIIYTYWLYLFDWKKVCKASLILEALREAILWQTNQTFKNTTPCKILSFKAAKNKKWFLISIIPIISWWRLWAPWNPWRQSKTMLTWKKKARFMAIMTRSGMMIKVLPSLKVSSKHSWEFSKLHARFFKWKIQTTNTLSQINSTKIR